MANATYNMKYEPVGPGGRDLNMPVDGGAHIYTGTMVAQLAATGMLCPASTAASGPVIGVASHECDNSAGGDGVKRCMVHCDRVFHFANGSGGNAFSEASLIGAEAFAYDDHTVYDNDASGTLFRAGFFCGMTPDGLVKVYIPGPVAVASLADFVSLETRLSDDESVTSASADASLTTRVSTEECTRASQAASLTTRVSTEECTRASQATSLTTRVSTEECTRASQVTSLTTRVSTAESEEAADVTSIDARISSLIASIDA